MQQVLFHIPITFGGRLPQGIPIYGFGMMLLIAFFVCTSLASRRARREGVSGDVVSDLAVWIFLGGLLGARITYMLGEHKWNGIVDFLVQLPRIWDGGIVLYGSVLGAVAAVALAMPLVFHRQGLTMLQLSDIVAPSVALGIALGRVGCLLNGCCYGQPLPADTVAVPVHFPLSAPPRYALVDAGLQTVAGFTLDLDQPADGARIGKVAPGSPAEAAGLRPGDRIVEANGKPIHGVEDLSQALSGREWPRGQNVLNLQVSRAAGGGAVAAAFTPRTIGLHPTQLYETISMTLLFLLLSAFYPFRTRRGEVTALLMICYGAHRYLNELLRGDPRPEGFEWIGSVVLVGGGVLLWLWLRSRPREFSLDWGPSAATHVVPG